MWGGGGGWGWGGVDGEEQEEEEEEEEEGRRWQQRSKLCISVNTRPLTLINLPFPCWGEVCVCVCRGGVGGGIWCLRKKKFSVIIYAHGCTPINCKERKKRKRKLVYSPPCGRPVFLCEPKLHYFRQMKDGRGWWGGCNVCMMSKKGIKIKEGIMA